MTAVDDRPATRFDDDIRPYRQPLHKSLVATRFRELLQAVFVALVAVAVITVDSLPREQVIALAIAFFLWTGVYGFAMVWEARS